MKFNKDFSLHHIAGEDILMRQGGNEADLTRIISLNPTSKLLFDQLLNKQFTVCDVENILLENFDISNEVAHRDAAHWIERLRACNVIID